jgi:fumarate hydratase, class I
MMIFTQKILALIQKTASNLPADIIAILKQAQNLEKSKLSKFSLDIISKNIKLAKEQKAPLCQDTGYPTFFVNAKPEHWKKIRKAIEQATKQATQKGILRANSVDILTNKNIGNVAKIEFEPSSSEKIKIALLLKGGGSENVSAQVALPMETDFGLAKRDLAGVKKAVLQIVKNAGGKGCAPGIISVVIGGDRVSGFALAKKNLLKKISTRSKHVELAKLETQILHAANQLKIGVMGLGGQTTLLDCKIDTLNRHPASYFVTVVYSCWAMRRGSVEFKI